MQVRPAVGGPAAAARAAPSAALPAGAEARGLPQTWGRVRAPHTPGIPGMFT
jgi:hypothetical protein